MSASKKELAGMLGQLRRKGVRLWSQDGRLHYQASRGVLTRHELQSLKESREELIALLDAAAAADAVQPRYKRPQSVARVPLTYSQLSHWRMYELGTRRHLRQLCTATHLRGRLDVSALIRSLEEMVRRHEALRTKIVVVGGIPEQHIAERGEINLEITQLREVPEYWRETEVQRRIKEHVLEPTDVTKDPLFKVQLLQFDQQHSVLIVSMEHILSDGYSINILLRDLFTAYGQAVEGAPFSLRPIAVQFADYAVWQRNTAQDWEKKHADYWRERLDGAKRLRFPRDRNDASAVGWGNVSLTLEGETRAALCEWSRKNRTTLVMSVLSVYIAVILRWCNASDLVIRYQTDGRVGSDIENTIGFFAAALHLRIELTPHDSFIDLAQRVLAEYCKAYEHMDSSYLEVEEPRPEITRSTAFNWLPNVFKTDAPALLDTNAAVVPEPVSFENPLIDIMNWDAEPAVLFLDTGTEITGGLYFPRDGFSQRAMQAFADNFRGFVAQMLRRPEQRIMDLAVTRSH